MDERVWRLPGPRGFVRDVVAEHRRGRHVAVVLPTMLAADAEFTDSLAVAIIDELGSQWASPRRIYDAGPDRSVLEALSEALIFHDQPATVAELLSHPEVKDTVAVLVTSDLSMCARGEVPVFLRDVERQAHGYGTAGWLSIVVIVARCELPAFSVGTSSDTVLTTTWWWGRVARWDAAAHIAGLSRAGGILDDVRAESITEVARWDLDLAEHLAESWSGDPAGLPALLNPGVRTDSAGRPPFPLPRSAMVGPAGLRPPDELLAFWDAGLIGGWHDTICPAPAALADDPARLDRWLWAAQARVLLPWIEERSAVLLGEVTDVLGPARLTEVLRTRFSPPASRDALIEIAVLDKVVRVAIGSARPELRDASRRLRDARNSLAHLRSLALAEQEGLIEACRFLR